MAASAEELRAAVQYLQQQFLNRDRALNAHIAFAEAGTLLLHDKKDKSNERHHKSSILDLRKIYPEKLTNVSR